jgi:hypothetical protein
MHETIDKYRVFPRFMMMFMMYMMLVFHDWFTQGGTLKVTDMGEWAIVGYGTVMATFVGFAKFYMESRK